MKNFLIGYLIGFLSPFIFFYGGFIIIGIIVAIKKLLRNAK